MACSLTRRPTRCGRKAAETFQTTQAKNKILYQFEPAIVKWKRTQRAAAEQFPDVEARDIWMIHMQSRVSLNPCDYLTRHSSRWTRHPFSTESSRASALRKCVLSTYRQHRWIRIAELLGRRLSVFTWRAKPTHLQPRVIDYRLCSIQRMRLAAHRRTVTSSSQQNVPPATLKESTCCSAVTIWGPSRRRQSFHGKCQHQRVSGSIPRLRPWRTLNGEHIKT